MGISYFYAQKELGNTTLGPDGVYLVRDNAAYSSAVTPEDRVLDITTKKYYYKSEGYTQSLLINDITADNLTNIFEATNITSIVGPLKITA